MVNNPICIVTGMERSGTTLVSQLLNAHPRVAAGVECGLLLREPSEFHLSTPFWEWLLNTGWSWGLLPQQRAKLLEARSYGEAYAMLNRYKGSAHTGELKQVIQASDLIYDKTPAYVYELPAIAEKTDAPIIVTFKSPAEAWASAKKHALPLRAFLRNYITATKAAASVPQAMIIFQDQISQDIDAVMRSVGDRIGLPGDYSMEAYNLRYGRFIESQNSFQKTRQRPTQAPPSGVSKFLEWYLRSELAGLRMRASSST